MNADWTRPYVGIPFVAKGRDFSGCDCGGLVLLALKVERGVIATDFEDYAAEDFADMRGVRKISRGIEAIMREWIVVEKPLPFDLCRFRYGREPFHYGVYVGRGQFLHVEKALLFSRLTPLDDLDWGPRFIEFRRHERLMGAPC